MRIFTRSHYNMQMRKRLEKLVDKLKEKQVIYYQDELNDEFSRAKIIPKKIDGDYHYFHRFIMEFLLFCATKYFKYAN